MINKSTIEKAIKSGISLRALAKKFGVTYQTIQYHRRRWGCPLLRKASTKGKNHASWKGGFFIDRNGYKMVLMPERGKASKYVMEHVIVAEKSTGRKIKINEVVHHIDGDKTNNAPSNLIIVRRKKHKALHRQLETIAMYLVRAGRINFDGHQYLLL